MRKVRVTLLDVSEILDSEQMIEEYLNEVIREKDSKLLCKALTHIEKAREQIKTIHGSV